MSSSTQAYCRIYEVLIDEKTEDNLPGSARAVHGQETVTYRGTEIPSAAALSQRATRWKEAIVATQRREESAPGNQLNGQLSGNAGTSSRLVLEARPATGPVKADGHGRTSLTPPGSGSEAHETDLLPWRT